MALLTVASATGLWALWITGSRGAMLGLCLGGFFVFLTVYFRQQIWKALAVVLLTGVVLFSGYAFWGIVPGGTHGYDDSTRLHMIKSSQAMWRDHKVSGVGLTQWEPNYAGKYFSYIFSKKAIQNRALNAYAKSKRIKPNAIPPKTRIAIENGSIRALTKTLMHPHNTIAWFFSTTGTIGGVGYLIFVFSFTGLFVGKIKEQPEEWIFQAGMWILLAVVIHGMVDSGIIYKGGARLLYVMLGITASYQAGKDSDLRTNQ